MITLDERGMKTSKPMNIPDIADLFCAAITGAVLKTKERMDADLAKAKTPKDKEKAEHDQATFKRYIFDELNHSFSKCLANAFPEYELHPEITEQAILEIENKLILEQAAKVKQVPEV